MTTDIQAYNKKQSKDEKQICELLMKEINKGLSKAESKIWHAHPVWFLDGNPIVGYSKQKLGIRLMFWSGADFNEEKLQPGSGKFKDASILYTDAAEVNLSDLKRWLAKSEKIQWDYQNIVKRKGVLLRRSPALEEKKKGTRKVCSRGHVFYKSSDCPSCPECWKGAMKNRPVSDIPKIGAPALRALDAAGITSLAQLQKFTSEEIANLHGVGPRAIRILHTALKAKKLAFKK